MNVDNELRAAYEVRSWHSFVQEVDHDGGKPLKRSVYAGRLRLQVVKDRKARTCERNARTRSRNPTHQK